MQIEIHPDAMREASASAEWYETKQPGYGQRFRAAVLSALDAIALSPLTYPVEPTASGARRMLLRRFPFAIVFYVEAETIRVVAIYHASRLPGYWSNR
jgi:toxin ParE1/3/4